MPGSSKARTEFSNSTGPVLWSIDERGVASVVLNRPEVNNAYDGGLVDGLLRATDALKGLTDLRLILIRGNGRHFQAGADLKWIDAVAKSPREENISASRATAEAVRRLNLSPVPTLALVQGGCFGGGTGIIAACDVVIAADNAMFSISEVRWGLTAAIILPQLIHGIGLRQLRRYALTGERFGAEDARRIGLVHEVVPLSDLESAGTRMIGHFLDNGPNAITETKMLALGLANMKVDDKTFDRLIESHAAKRQSNEAAEGLASFAEKRSARWGAVAPPRKSEQ
ncbi:MAG: enoyl-CoA hydratase/isomerase family protein [Hyphomicrobiales bacterium]|nr:enoyl-CoA hydratase/isomerase family protein [Hyphomicrobiales bacterium]MBV9519796.1 enoyl-CoA hydratase/isomerase family protein [Hyphomicrobiales bacterium]